MASFVIGGSSGAFATASAVGTNIIKGDYTNLSQLRSFLDLGSADIADDAQLRRFIVRASKAIDGFTRRRFYPQRKGAGDLLVYDLPDDRDYLRIDDVDLLEVKGLSDVNGASEIDSGAYWLKTGDLWNISPYDRIILDDSSGSLFKFSSTTQRAVHLDAIVGFHSRYGDEAWVNSGASLTDNLDAATTTASVSASGAFNSLGISPRFHEGQIWRIGSGSTEEFAYVKDTISTSTVRLIRGINGTSAFSHGATTAVFTWQPEQDIEFAATELAAFLYLKAVAPMTNRVAFPQMGFIEMPNTWPEITLDRIKRYRKSGIYSF